MLFQLLSYLLLSFHFLESIFYSKLFIALKIFLPLGLHCRVSIKVMGWPFSRRSNKGGFTIGNKITSPLFVNREWERRKRQRKQPTALPLIWSSLLFWKKKITPPWISKRLTEAWGVKSNNDLVRIIWKKINVKKRGNQSNNDRKPSFCAWGVLT